MIAGGVFAVVFLSVALVSSYFSLAQVLLDLVGTNAAGAVVEVRESSIWQRFRTRAPVFIVRYRFDTAAGETVTGEQSVNRSTWRGLGTGSTVTVGYLRLLPALNRVERPDRDLFFYVLAALTLVCLWLAGMSIRRGFVPPPD